MFVAFYALILDLFAAPSDAQFYTLLEGPVSLLGGPGPTRGTGNSNTAGSAYEQLSICYIACSSSNYNCIGIHVAT